MIRILTVRTSVQCMQYNCTTRGSQSMWVHRSRFDCSAAAQSIGCSTWVMRRRLGPRFSFSMTRDQYYIMCKFCNSWSLRSTGHHPRSCGSPLVGCRFWQTLCNRWCPRTGFAGRLIIWRPWDCGGRLVLKEFVTD